jgi:hypothetical protein
MPYQISRDGQLYGPYTLEDLQRYVTSGNVLLTDLAKSEEMANWVPVSQILSQASAPPAASTPPAYVSSSYTAPPIEPAYASGAAYPSGAVYPDPPNLHWALVLLIGFFTCGLFFVIWDLVQALWAKRVEPATKALLYFIVYAVFWVLYFCSYAASMAPQMMRNETPRISPVTGLLWLGFIVFIIIYRFTMKATIERHFNGPEPIGLRLSGIMTFFFGGLYFQYHFSRINQIKQGYRYRGY